MSNPVIWTENRLIPVFKLSSGFPYIQLNTSLGQALIYQVPPSNSELGHLTSKGAKVFKVLIDGLFVAAIIDSQYINAQDSETLHKTILKINK